MNEHEELSSTQSDVAAPGGLETTPEAAAPTGGRLATPGFAGRPPPMSPPMALALQRSAGNASVAATLTGGSDDGEADGLAASAGRIWRTAASPASPAVAPPDFATDDAGIVAGLGAAVQQRRRGVGGVLAREPEDATPAAAPSVMDEVGFVREEGLNLRVEPDQKSGSLATLKFGARVHVIEKEGPHPGWHKVAVPGSSGFVFAPRIHFAPPELVQKDPALKLIRVRPGQTFWGLVKEQYGIQGNEGTADQNINHFINAIRAVNNPEAFSVETDTLDDIGNAVVPGRDATDTKLKADFDLWIPSFGVAAGMDVGSGTVTGEAARVIKKVEQTIADFKTACLASGKYIPDAVAQHVGEMGEGLLHGLIDFALDAAKILAISTAAGALIGALFGGVGAVPGAEIGFEVGLLIIKVYGLYLLVDLILSIAGSLLSRLGDFVSQVWAANGDRKQLEEAGKTLADALGILAGATLLALVMIITHQGFKALGKTKFAETVGETELMKWLSARSKGTTSKGLGEKGKGSGETKAETKPAEEKPAPAVVPKPVDPAPSGHQAAPGTTPTPDTTVTPETTGTTGTTGAPRTPPAPLRGPASRHTAVNVKQRTLTKETNTVIEPDVNVAGDVADINAGRATRVGDKYVVNGRTYGAHDGTLYPVEGPGFHKLSRAAFKALGVYNEHGNTPRAAEILEKMKTPDADRATALTVWERTRR